MCWDYLTAVIEYTHDVTNSSDLLIAHIVKHFSIKCEYISV